MKKKYLILGIGNFLLGDEGVGIHVVRELEKAHLPSEVDLLDGGTGGLHLLGILQEYEKVILIDACLDDYPEGHIRRISPKYSTDFPPSLSAHDVGLKDLVNSMLLLEDIPEITLIAISVKDFNRLAVSLTPVIAKASRRAVKLTLNLLTNAGYGPSAESALTSLMSDV